MQLGDVNASPKVNGTDPTTPTSIYMLLGSHASMLQASTGEASPWELQATLQAAVTKTKYEKINLHYAWEKA